MSSYELLELLEFMPERGAFKSAMRGGEYSQEELVWRHVATEISHLRAITEAANSKKSAQMKTFPSVAEMRQNLREAEDAEERREGIFAFADRSPKAPPDDLFDEEEVG